MGQPNRYEPKLLDWNQRFAVHIGSNSSTRWLAIARMIPSEVCIAEWFALKENLNSQRTANFELEGIVERNDFKRQSNNFAWISTAVFANLDNGFSQNLI